MTKTVKKLVVGGKLRSKITRKRTRKCAMEVISSAISDNSDCTSSTSKRFKTEDSEDFEISSEISL